MRGEFLEVSQPERVVFTWGFTDPDVGVPPGSSVVDVTLTPDAGGTRPRLEHRDLPVAAVESHAGGWIDGARAPRHGGHDHPRGVARRGPSGSSTRRVMRPAWEDPGA